MKKILFMILAMGFASQSYAKDLPPGGDKFVAITILKQSIEGAKESTLSLIQEVEGLVAEYNSLGRLQIVKKSKIARENCAIVMANYATNYGFIVASLENLNGKDISVPELETDVDVKLLGITEYVTSGTKAANSCQNPSESLVHLKKAYAGIVAADAFMQTIKVELP